MAQVIAAPAVRRRAMPGLAVAGLLAGPRPARALPASLDIADMTWPEVRDAIAELDPPAGK
jgi:hypothetical protein